MAQQDNGPATGTASLLFGGAPTTSIEVHIPVGTDPLPPSAQNVPADPQAGTFLYNVTGGGNNGNATQLNAISTTLSIPALATTIKFQIPA
jgi:hypothetical protein